MAIKAGWTGRVFEDFTVGDIYEHPLGRTRDPGRQHLVHVLTMNANLIHFDASIRATLGRPLVVVVLRSRWSPASR